MSPYDADGISPALDFETTIDGEAYATVFKLLKETQKQYSLSWAAEMTGIDEDVLVEITDKYANCGPSILSFGFGGGEKFYNADVAGHAAVLLATLVGSFGTDIPGWGAGAYVKRLPEDFLERASLLPGRCHPSAKSLRRLKRASTIATRKAVSDSCGCRTARSSRLRVIRTGQTNGRRGLISS